MLRGMAKKAREWEVFDIEVAEYFSQLGEEEDPMPSFRVIGSSTGMSHTRVADILKQHGGTPTLNEFISLCRFFGKIPSEIMKLLENGHLVAIPSDVLDEVNRENLIAETVSLTKSDPMSFAAYRDGHKHDPDPDGGA